MKFCTLAAVLLVSLFATSLAVPAYKRMAYYQQPSARSAPLRTMYLQQYVQQPASSQTHARSTAYVAGDEGVGASTYLKGDAASVEQQNAAESVLNDAGLNEGEAYPAAGSQVSTDFEGTFADGGFDSGVSGAADAAGAGGAAGFSSAEIPASAEVPEVPQAPVVDNQVLEDDSASPATFPQATSSYDNFASDNDAKVPREYNFENPAQVPDQAPAAEDAVPEIPAVPEVPEVPSVYADQAPADEAPVAVPAKFPFAAAAPAVPAVVPVVKPIAVAPPKRYLPPRKKVIVKLDEQSEAANDDDEEADADAYRPARIPNARRPVKGNGNAVAAKGNKAQLPAGTFFPVSFGGTSGGAIAIANSFSTGEGGSATSHAIAYGSPDAARSKARPVRRH